MEDGELTQTRGWMAALSATEVTHEQDGKDLTGVT